MAFTLDFSKADEGNVADGTYETVISTVAEDAAKTGTEFLNFDLIVRNDVDQKFKNSHIFQKIYRNKETGKYPEGRLMAIAKAAGLNDGKHYNSFEDFCNDFQGQPIQVTVRTNTSEYQGKTYTDLNVTRGGWKKTAFPQVQHQWKKGMEPTSATPAVDVSDDDLPF